MLLEEESKVASDKEDTGFIVAPEFLLDCSSMGYRQSANAFRDGFCRLRSTRYLLTLAMMVHWTHLLLTNRAPIVIEDLALLAVIAMEQSPHLSDNKKVPLRRSTSPAEWALATLTYAHLELKQGNLTNGARYLRSLIVCDLSEAQRQAKVFYTDNKRKVAVGAIIDDLIAQAKTQMVTANLFKELPLPLCFEEPTKLLRLLDAFEYRPQGTACTFCGVSATDTTPLFRCKRCYRTWYCSPECQKHHWKDTHKHACREPKDFRPRDYVRIQGLLSNPELNGSICEVHSTVHQPTGVRHGVMKIGDTKVISIHSDKLKLIVPSQELCGP